MHTRPPSSIRASSAATSNACCQASQGPIAAEKTPTGQSNPTFLLSSPSGRYVLRKKPPGQLLKSAHAVDREYKVMKGLGQTDVPVPRMLHLCEDDSVLGTAFFVMEFVDGRHLLEPGASRTC